MGKIETFLDKHWAWIMSVIVAIGFYMAIVQQQAIAIDQLKADQDKMEVSIVQLQRCAMELESIKKSIDEIKVDIREIKKTLYKPVIGDANERSIGKNN